LCQGTERDGSRTISLVKTRVVVSWSGGKDSALILDRLLRDERYDVAALITTVEQDSSRVTAHGVDVELVRQQSDALGVQLLLVPLPPHPSNDVYLERFRQTLVAGAPEAGAIAFGDIFLEDLRLWRERSFAAMGLSSLFPLWHGQSHDLAAEFLSRGFSAVLCCVNGAHLDKTYLGRLYDDHLFESLPTTVDRCGENGEFHTFVFDGPIFRDPVRYAIGATTYKPVMHGSPVTGHWFCDLLPNKTTPHRCPLCGSDNACAAASGEQSCWCFTERIPHEVQDRIPPYARNVACICQACATSSLGISAFGSP
jgi:uncharacterized protein (TIGR00290 family)